MGDLKKLAFEWIAVSISSLSSAAVVEEAFSVFASRQGPRGSLCFDI